MRILTLALLLLAPSILSAELLTVRDSTGKIVAVIQVPAQQRTAPVRDATGKITGTIERTQSGFVFRDPTGKVTGTVTKP